MRGLWAGAVCGGEGEGDPGGDGSPGVLYPAENGAAAGGEEEWKEAGVGEQLGGGRSKRGGKEGPYRRIDCREEEDGGEKSDGEEEDEDLRGKEQVEE